MQQYTLGKTNITVPKNAFGALPIQRVDSETAVRLLRKAYEGGMRFFDTARAYTDSESKLGKAFEGIRDKIYIASKTMAKTPDQFFPDLEATLGYLKTDHLDLYQLHNARVCYRPGDGTGMYECMLEAREKGLIDHIGITTHRISVAEEIIESGLYETLQYPFSYLSTEREIALAEECRKKGMGFIAMKGLSGGLLTNARVCMAFMNEYPVLPIWGIQRESELDEWLSFFKEDAVMTDEVKAVIEADRASFSGDFCRSCGYCEPCTVGIVIHQCARMSQMIRRAPSKAWTDEHWQKEMAKIENCVDCGLCKSRCPYELDTPNLLRKNYKDYQDIIAGRTVV